jgi:hypothetical protein
LTAGTKATKNMLNHNWMGVESKIAIDGGEKVKKERNISRGAKE